MNFAGRIRRRVENDYLGFVRDCIGDSLNGQLEGTINQRFSFFSLGYDVDFTPGPGRLDPRLGVGITVLLLAIEGSKD